MPMDGTSPCCVKTKQKRRSFGYIRIKKVKMSQRLKQGLLFSSLTFFVAAYLRAAENSPQTVLVKIETILASNQSGEFDSRLKVLEKQLRVLKYRSYRLLKEESQNVPSQGSDVLAFLFQQSIRPRSEEHTSELQSRFDIVCRL